MAQILDAKLARDFMQRLHAAVNAHDAQAITFETAEFSQLELGLLQSHTVILNMMSLARELGAMPERGSPGERMGVWLQHVAVRMRK